MPDHLRSVDPIHCDGFTCVACRGEISNGYKRCVGCDQHYGIDFNLCFSCFEGWSPDPPSSGNGTGSHIAGNMQRKRSETNPIWDLTNRGELCWARLKTKGEFWPSRIVPQSMSVWLPKEVQLFKKPGYVLVFFIGINKYGWLPCAGKRDLELVRRLPFDPVFTGVISNSGTSNARHMMLWQEGQQQEESKKTLASTRREQRVAAVTEATQLLRRCVVLDTIDTAEVGASNATKSRCRHVVFQTRYRLYRPATMHAMWSQLYDLLAPQSARLRELCPQRNLHMVASGESCYFVKAGAKEDSGETPVLAAYEFVDSVDSDFSDDAKDHAHTHSAACDANRKRKVPANASNALAQAACSEPMKHEGHRDQHHALGDEHKPLAAGFDANPEATIASLSCISCDKLFTSRRGLINHRARWCPKKDHQQLESVSATETPIRPESKRKRAEPVAHEADLGMLAGGDESKQRALVAHDGQAESLSLPERLIAASQRRRGVGDSPDA